VQREQKLLEGKTQACVPGQSPRGKKIDFTFKRGRTTKTKQRTPAKGDVRPGLCRVILTELKRTAGGGGGGKCSKKNHRTSLARKLGGETDCFGEVCI